MEDKDSTAKTEPAVKPQERKEPFGEDCADLIAFIDPDMVYWWENRLKHLTKEVDEFEKKYGSCKSNYTGNYTPTSA